MTSINNLIARRNMLTKTIKEYESLIQFAPEGELISRRQPSGNFRYTKKIHLPDNKIKEIYLGKNATSEAYFLAQKSYARKMLPSLQQELTLLNKLITIRMKESEHDLFIKKHPGISSLLQMSSRNEALMAWKNAPYNRNMNYPDQLKVTTVVPGLLVRSKSEADIISRLEYYGIPYHYEELLIINNATFAMDFTCLALSSEQKMYWDHRGMLDNQKYIQKTLSCDEIYLNAGIVPWVNLIVTTETKNSPLDIQWVDTIIQHYLL